MFRRIPAILVALLLVTIIATGAAAADHDDHEDYLVDLEPVNESALSDDPIVAMQAHANATQEPFTAAVARTDGVTVEQRYWITNAVLVSVDTGTVDPDVLAGYGNVSAVTAPETARSPAAAPRAGAHTEGLEQIHAPETWENFGTRGEGSTIAILDTGVDGEHPDITVDRWRDFNDEPSSEPLDYGEHGTHVSGIAVGGNESGQAIGVAPEASLHHGAVLTDCEPLQCEGEMTTVYEGMEWAIEGEADVISLSLGADGYEASSIEAVRNANAAGIVVVAAVGNDGAGSSTSPGNVYDAIAVGAVDDDDSLPAFTGGETIDTDDVWGDDAPEDWPASYDVPDLTAPGVGIESAQPGGGYARSSGTSMATPYVSGAVALAQSATERDLRLDEIRAALAATAMDPEDDDVRYGSGILDTHGVTENVTDRGSMEGTVTDTVTGDSIPNATVRIDGREIAVDDEGQFAFAGLVGEETYTITVDAAGYTAHEEALFVERGANHRVDITLAGDGELALTVTDATFDAPVDDATIALDREGSTYTTEGGENGTYRLADLPSGRTYALRGNASGYHSADAVIDMAGDGPTDHDLALTGTAEIDVTVIDDQTGDPIPDVSVVATHPSGMTAYVPPGRPNAAIPVPGRGESIGIAAEAPGYIAETRERRPGDGDRLEESFDLRGDATVRVDVVDAHFGGTIEDASVALHGPRGSYEAHDGVVEGVPSGRTYTLVTAAGGYVPTNRSLAVDSAGETTTSVDLSGNARLAIGISGEGEPIPNATISVTRPDGATFTADARTGEDGTLDVTLPGTGTRYEIAVRAVGFAENTSTSAPIADGETAPIAIELEPLPDGMPGFGVVAAVLAILGVGILRRRL